MFIKNFKCVKFLSVIIIFAVLFSAACLYAGNTAVLAMETRDLDSQSDSIKSVGTIPWVFELFITEYNNLNGLAGTGIKLTGVFLMIMSFGIFSNRFIFSVKHFKTNEFKLFQEMKIHISRLTAG